MAGGKGSRLRPITENIPKPLLPIAGVPAIVRIIRHLKDNGITEAAVTVGHLSDMIESELGNECEGIPLRYIREKNPMGTAGGVRGARDFIGDDDFVVISGDTLCECDISTAIKLRRETNSVVTLILTEVSDPGEYGVVLTDESGVITGFSEKPSLSSTYASTVNTGIYVMSPRIFDFIPNGVSDFGRDIFPLLLSNGEKMTAVTDLFHWCDIGDYHSYRMANLRYNGGGNVIGRDCKIEKCDILGSVLLDRVTVGKDTKIENSIICADTIIGRSCMISENCVIGAKSIIGGGSVLDTGTVIEEGSVVPEGSYIRTGTSVSRSSLTKMLGGNGIDCNIKKLSPSFCMRLGSSLSEATGYGRIGIMTDGTPDSERIRSAILRGIGMGGGESMVLGEGFEASCSYAPIRMSLDLSLFIRCKDESCKISFFDRDGLYPKRDFERALISAITSDKRDKNDNPVRLSKCDFTNEHYLPMLLTNRCPLEGYKVTVKNENMPSQFLKRVLLSLGADVCDNGIKLSLSDDGFSLNAEQNSFVCDDYHIKAVIIRYLIRNEISLPASMPASIFDLCFKKADVYSHCPSGDGEDEARAGAKNTPELIHGCAAAAEVLALLSTSGRTLKELVLRLPTFAVSSYDCNIKDDSLFAILPHLGIPSGDGVVSEYERGSVRVIPTRNGYHLISEAASGEYAEELISLSEREIRALLKKEKK